MKKMKPEWKHKLEVDGDTLRIVNGVNAAGSGATETPTTGGAGSAGAGAKGKIDLEQIKNDLRNIFNNASAINII